MVRGFGDGFGIKDGGWNAGECGVVMLLNLWKVNGTVHHCEKISQPGMDGTVSEFQFKEQVFS